MNGQPSELGGTRKGTNGVSTNGVTANSVFFGQRDFLGTPVSLLVSPQKCQGVPFPPIHPSKSITSAAAPLAPTPFDRNQRRASRNTTTNDNNNDNDNTNNNNDNNDDDDKNNATNTNSYNDDNTNSNSNVNTSNNIITNVILLIPRGMPTKMPVALIDVLAAHQLKEIQIRL